MTAEDERERALKVSIEGVREMARGRFACGDHLTGARLETLRTELERILHGLPARPECLADAVGAPLEVPR